MRENTSAMAVLLEIMQQARITCHPQIQQVGTPKKVGTRQIQHRAKQM